MIRPRQAMPDLQLLSQEMPERAEQLATDWYAWAKRTGVKWKD
ncbi:MAG: hypothetical protein RIC55_25570 [Pirellulaceae bacterium]